MGDMLKVAIVGCGKIADSHAMQIQRIAGCEIVGVCDREPLMAKQFYERFPVKRYFTDLAELLDKSRPDVVHITTPAESHFDVARFCLEQGCHVYVEKPFTLYAEQAQRLVNLAERKGVKLTAGHNDQFSHVARRMRALVKSGYLGGAAVHVESYYSYDLGDPSYARALLGDKNHWVRRLPGKLLQNVISHGIARIAEFLTSDSPQVIAYGFVSSLLKQIDESEIVDELRVIIGEEGGTTAYFTFSSQMRPAIHQLRVYGTKNGLVLDQDHEILIKLRGQKFKSYADFFIPPAIFAKQNLANLVGNFKLFLGRDFQMDSGMKYLIEAFYRSIREDVAVPIPYREILLTARIMDNIFEQVSARRSQDHLRLQGDRVPAGNMVPGVDS
ncbi:MAG: Gfo/Idh/MocA family oxidoreductase [Candidatus Acidiferrales bacterium]